MMNKEAHAAIIGGGIMGADIAVIFAAGGWMAHIVEPAEAVRGNLSARLKTGLAALNQRMLTIILIFAPRWRSCPGKPSGLLWSVFPRTFRSDEMASGAGRVTTYPDTVLNIGEFAPRIYQQCLGRNSDIGK